MIVINTQHIGDCKPLFNKEIKQTNNFDTNQIGSTKPFIFEFELCSSIIGHRKHRRWYDMIQNNKKINKFGNICLPSATTFCRSVRLASDAYGFGYRLYFLWFIYLFIKNKVVNLIYLSAFARHSRFCDLKKRVWMSKCEILFHSNLVDVNRRLLVPIFRIQN